METMQMLNDSTTLAIRPGCRLQWEPRQNAWVLLFPEGMVQLSDTAHLILNLCRQPIRITEVVSQVEALFPGEAVADDVRDFLGDAYHEQWIELH